MSLGAHPGFRVLLSATLRDSVAVDAGTRAMYAMDVSNYRHDPLAVVVPRDTNEPGRVGRLYRDFDRLADYLREFHTLLVRHGRGGVTACEGSP